MHGQYIRSMDRQRMSEEDKRKKESNNNNNSNNNTNTTDFCAYNSHKIYD
jgi:hypothetical protein